MPTIHEPAREIPVIAGADVVVCGGGPGGFSAAIAAARHGARTVLIERYGFLGGLATGGLVAPILGHTASDSTDLGLLKKPTEQRKPGTSGGRNASEGHYEAGRGLPIVEGILREITERMHALGGAPTWEETLTQWGIRFDAEALKIVLDEMCEEAGVRLLLHTWVADAVVRDGALHAVAVESKTGRGAVTGRLFIDATGDADVAYRAGAPTTHGRAFDGRPEAMGAFFHLAGFTPVDAQRADELWAKVRQGMLDGRFRFYNERFLSTNTHHKDHTSPNMARFGGDSDSAEDLTVGELHTRRQMWALVRYLRENEPGFEDLYVQQSSVQIGPRESRQIVGPYALSGDDIVAGRKFADAVARGSWWIDIHCPLGHTYPVHLCTAECPRGEACPYWAAEHERMRRSRAELRPPQGDWYDIPYRSLLSVGLPNLLSSGRCISATHEGMAGARVMGTCIAIGQAAGTAAALAADAGVDPAQVDVAELQEVLRRDGQLV